MEESIKQSNFNKVFAGYDYTLFVIFLYFISVMKTNKYKMADYPNASPQLLVKFLPSRKFVLFENQIRLSKSIESGIKIYWNFMIG